MNVGRLTALYGAFVNGSVGKDIPQQIFLDQIGVLKMLILMFLKKGRVKSTKNKRETLTRVEAKKVCYWRSRWKSMVSAYPCVTQA